MSDDVKVVVLVSKTNGHLQEHLCLNAASLTRYGDVRDVIMNDLEAKQTQWTLARSPKGEEKEHEQANARNQEICNLIQMRGSSIHCTAMSFT